MIAGIGRALLLFLLLVIVMAGVAFGVLQTRFAKDRIAQFAEEALTNGDQSARIEGLGGFLPFDIRVERFALSDREGVWLEVDDARLEVSPTRLVSRELLIDRITAARVAVHRQPDLPPAEEEEPAEPFALPELPDLPESLPVGLRAERIGVERIELGEPVIGEAMQLAFRGSVTTSPARERVDLHLDVDRTDRETLAATIALGVDLPGETIGIDVKVDETGGLVARLANMPEAGPLHLSLDGDGPLSAWQARLDLDIGNLVKGNVDLDLAYSQTPSIDLVAEIVPAEDTVPPEIDDIVGERLHLALQAAHPAPQQVELKTLSLTSRALTVDGSGKASLDDNIVEGTITARMDDLDRLSGIAGTPLGGALRLTLDAVGTFVDPTLQVDVDGSSLSGADFLVQTAEGRFDVSFLAPLDAGFEGVDVKGGLTVEGMQQGGEPLRPEDALTLAVKAHVPLEGEARIEQLDIVGETVDLSTRAVLAMPSLAGTARIEGHVESLGELMQALGPMAPPELALQGSLELTADATIGDEAKEIEADIRLTGSQIRGLPEGADPLLGSSPSLATRVTFVQGEAVRVDGLKLDAAALSMDGGASLGLDSGQALDGEVNLAIPALAAFSGIAKQELAGRADATVTLAGSLGQPKAEAKARVQDLQAAGQGFDEIRLDATASGPADNLAGRVVLEAEQFGRTLGVSSDYALTPKTLELAGLALEGPATDIRGGLTLDRTTSLAGGKLKGGISDLSALEPWHKQALAGSLAVDVELDDRSGRQDVVARIEIPTASGDFGRISGLSADARVNDALGKLAVDAGIELAGFSAPDLEVTAAKVDLEGDAGLLNLNASASGRQKGEPFDITTGARLDVAGAPQQIFLDSLNGRAAGQDIELRAPARLVLDKGVMQIDKLDLVVGEARIQGGASMNDGRLAGRFDLGPLPLSMLAAFGAPELTGTAEGRIELDGSSAKPRIGVTLDLAQIRPPGRFYRNKPGFDANIATTIGNGTLSLDVRLAGLADQPGTITLTMPLGLSLDPPAFEFANTARLDGTIRAKADIGKLSVLAPLDGQRIAGIADIDLAIGGRVNRPDIRGRIVLDNGFVQDEGSGFTLADTALELEVGNQRVEIAKLQATDGGKGRIALEGSVGIDPEGSFPFDLKLTSKGMRVLESTLGRAFASSDLALSGDARRGRIEGTITLDSANIQIPGGGGIDPVALDVTEVGKGAPSRNEQAGGPKDTGPGYDLSLDIDFRAPSKLYVRGRGLESEWGGDLDITGKAASPDIAGEIEFRRGYLDFLDRRFDIRTGRIGFTGGLIPEIELTAAAQGTELVAIVSITGPANKPDFELSSEPSRPQDEILSDLLFKRDVSSITPAQGVRLAAAVRRLEGGGVDAIGSLRDTVGLDTLDIGGDEDSGATAKAGKYIADGVFLEVERGLTAGSGKARVEIELSDNITVNTEVDENAQSGVGIEWRMDY